MPLYELSVNEQLLNDLFILDYPMLSFHIRICLEAKDLDHAHKQVKKLLYDANFRRAVAGEVKHS